MAPSCPRCTRPTPEDARFCPACGTRLGSTPEPGRFASPEAYTPAHLAERILESRAAVAGERKQVTVLFADVKGSMELFSDLDLEEAGPIVDRVLEYMIEAVHRYEGTVNQVMGDGIMALFGAPLAREDHAVRACYAALSMQERIGAFGDAIQRAHGTPVQVRIGLNSGEVVVRSVGSDLHMTYTAVGQTVNLAARMEQMAKPGSILAAGDTVALAGPGLSTRPLGPVRVKGMPAPIEVHEVSGAASLRSRLDTMDARGLAPLVGRQDELARLHDRLAAARAGAGQAVSVVGDAGLGKSRLLHEFTRACRAAGCLVLETGGLSYGRALAYRAGVDLNRRYFRIDEGDAAETIREKVGTKLLGLGGGLEDGVPPMLWLLGALPAGSPFLALEPATRRRRADEAAARVLERESRRQPMVLVFEDLQWVDSGTRATLDALIERLPASAMIVVTHRPEYDQPLTTDARSTRITLEPLPGGHAALLLDALMGADPALGPVKRRLVERTAGNPLFLEESVRSLAETGILGGARGGYRLARPVGAVEVPATVRALLAARIDRLPGGLKPLLQAASVIGERVAAELLDAIADMPADEVRRGLAELRAAGLLEEAALFPEVEYAFTHALAHDVAYESLLHDRRRALHARIVATIEAREPSRFRDRAARLAHHALAGEVWDKAVTSAREAGATMLARLVYRESVSWFEQALAALRHLPPDHATRSLEVDIRHDLHTALVPLGEHAQNAIVLGAAATLAEGLGDEPRLARALSFCGNNLWQLGQSRAAVETGLRAVAIAERIGDVGLQVVGNYSVGGALRALGDYAGAAACMRRNVALLAGRALHETFGLAGIAAVLSRDHLAWSLAELGQFEEATATAEEAIRNAEAAEHTYSLAHAHSGLGGVLLRRGRIWEAQGVLERGLALCADLPVLFPALAGDLAVVQALCGKVDHGLELAGEAVAQAEQMGRLGRLSLIVTHAGEVSLLAGRCDAAAHWAGRALALARTHGEQGNQVYALRLTGLIAAEGTPCDVEGARAAYGEAMAMAETLGMRPLLARCHLGLGRLARLIGEPEAAEPHIARAAAMLKTLGMAFWLDRLALDRVGPAPE